MKKEKVDILVIEIEFAIHTAEVSIGWAISKINFAGAEGGIFRKRSFFKASAGALFPGHCGLTWFVFVSEFPQIAERRDAFPCVNK